MSTEQEQIATIVLSPIAMITGYLGLTMADVDLIMAIGLKAISMISVIFIILVNWDKAIFRLKKFFKLKKKNMKKTIFFLLVSTNLLAQEVDFNVKVNTSPKIYYVATDGNNSNNGLTANAAWATLTYAIGFSSPVVAGDIIYVKAGNYGAENVVCKKSGTLNEPISILGYKTTAGDHPPLLADAGDPYASYVTSDMPTYNGGNRTTGIGFDIRNSQNIVLKNIQIEQYSIGIIFGNADSLADSRVKLYNIGCHTIGSTTADYSGQGILCGSLENNFASRSTIEKCLVVNCCAELITVLGNYNKILDTKVYCNENTSNASSDYYVTIFGSYNLISNCYAYRTAGLDVDGHGFTIKSNAEDVIDGGDPYVLIRPTGNKVINCTAVNMGESFCVRHRWVTNNTFSKCTATGTYAGTYLGSSGEGIGIVIRDGASNNNFNGIIVNACSTAIKFLDTSEDGDTGGSPTGHPGNGNSITNCIFNICYIGINFNDYSLQSDAGTNTVANCTFYKCDYVHYVERRAVNMIYKNNIYSTAQGDFRDGTYSTDVAAGQFANCDFYSVSIPGGFVAGTNIAGDPLFVSAATNDFHLGSSSPCKNAGVAISTIKYDFDNRRKQTGVVPVIGAFER